MVVVALLAIAAMTAVLFFHVNLNPNDGSDGDDDELTPHPFNFLNRWDIPWYMGSEWDIVDVLTDLYSIGPRYDYTDGYYEAAEYVIDYLNSLSLNASFWGPHESVVGLQAGYGTDRRAIVFGAHLDGPQSGPGIEQNGGGCAVVLTIARLLSNYRLPVDVYYCFFSGNMIFVDEQQLVRAMYGSKEVAAILSASAIDVIVYFNFDELLYVSSMQSQQERLVFEYGLEAERGYHKTRYFAELLKSFMSNAPEQIVTIAQSVTTPTDHQSFYTAGFPAINVRSGHVIDPESPPLDTPTSSDYSPIQALWVARAAACAAVYLSVQGNGAPTTNMLKSDLTPGGSATLRAVMTASQTLSVHGNTSVPSVLLLSANDTGGVLIPPTPIDDLQFSISSNEPAGLGCVSILVKNTGMMNVSIDLYLVYESDTDGDSIYDSQEYSWPAPDPPLDWDHDGLSDDEEHEIGTDIFKADTDGDGESDGIEVANGLDPLRDDLLEDLDGDGLSNIQELRYGTMPGNADSDGDGMPDGWEVYFGTDAIHPDAEMDYDNDTLTSLEEYRYGSHPLSPDGDFDLISDVEEIARGTDPLSRDTDGDGLSDFLEIVNGLDPLRYDCDLDLEPDGTDPNPRVSSLLVLIMITAGPILVGSVIFWRRIR